MTETKIHEDEEVTLDDLKAIVIKFQEEEMKKMKDKKSHIIENDFGNIVRENNRTGKINPKFCVKWHQLDKEFKINRVIEYSKRYTNENNFPKTADKKLRKIFVTNLVSDKLMIDYDSVNGRINKIINLSYNDRDGFQIGSYKDSPKMEFISKVSKISKCSTKNDNVSITTEDFIPKGESNNKLLLAEKEKEKEKEKIEIKVEKRKPKITLNLSKK